MNNSKTHLRDFIYSALFAALIIVLGFISIPIGPVPISGINLGVMLSGAVLSARQSIYSILIVILLGAAGLPVFSGFTGGIGILLGPRGGYYLGFVIGVGIISLLRGNNTNTFRLFTAIFIGGILIDYIIAIPWLVFITQMQVKQAIWLGMLPFLPGDILKALLSTILAKTLYKNIPALRR